MLIKKNMIAVDYKFATKCVIKSKIWFNIGKLIYLISKGSNDGYKLWLRYSEFDKNYEERHCYNLWSNFDELMPEDYEEAEENIYASQDEVEPDDLPEGW